MLYIRHPSSLEHDPSLLSPEHPDNPDPSHGDRGRDGRRRLARLAGSPRRRPRPSESSTGSHRRQSARSGTLCESGGGTDRRRHVRRHDLISGGAARPAGGSCAMVRAPGGRSEHGVLRRAPRRPSRRPRQRDGILPVQHVAIAAELAIRELGLRRVLILDWTCTTVTGRPRSSAGAQTSCSPAFTRPGCTRGRGRSATPAPGWARVHDQRPCREGTEGDVWLSVLEHVLVPVGLAFDPELVLISAALTLTAADPLGGCRLDEDTFASCLHVRDLGASLGAPIGAVLEGGYAPDALGAQCDRHRFGRWAATGRPSRSPPIRSSPHASPPKLPTSGRCEPAQFSCVSSRYRSALSAARHWRRLTSYSQVVQPRALRPRRARSARSGSRPPSVAVGEQQRELDAVLVLRLAERRTGYRQRGRRAARRRVATGAQLRGMELGSARRSWQAATTALVPPPRKRRPSRA